VVYVVQICADSGYFRRVARERAYSTTVVTPKPVPPGVTWP
jgi:hypothetical protein